MKCIVCGKYITRRFRLCSGCESEYGKHASDQPEWLRYLASKDEMEKRSYIQEYSIDLVEEINDTYSDFRMNGVFKEIYDIRERPTEEKALKNVKRHRYFNLAGFASDFTKD